MSRTKIEILKKLNDLKRSQMVDFAVAVANTFMTHINCPLCEMPNEIRDIWYSGIVKDLCVECGEELDFKTVLNIPENKEFVQWVSKRTYEDDPVEEDRIEKNLEYEITKVYSEPNMTQAAIDEWMQELIDNAWLDQANQLPGFDFSHVDDREIKFHSYAKCNKNRKPKRKFTEDDDLNEK